MFIKHLPKFGAHWSGRFRATASPFPGNRDYAPAAAAYDANPPAVPANSRERDTISALTGARRRPLGAAVTQSRACVKIKRRTPDEKVAHPNC